MDGAAVASGQPPHRRQRRHPLPGGHGRRQQRPTVTTTPGATSTLTQEAPATRPANPTVPAAGAATGVRTGARRSTPRCPGPYGPAGASNPRTSVP